MFTNRIIGSLMTAAMLALQVAAQTSPTAQASNNSESGGYFWPLIMFLIAASAFGAAYYFWRKNKVAIERSHYNYDAYVKTRYKTDSFDLGGLDANRELEWLRKAKKGTSGTNGKKSKTIGAPLKSPMPPPGSLDLDTKSFQEKMRKLQYSQLPINSFSELSPAKLYEPLPISDDPAVLDAIEQVNDEYEDDEAIREIAFRILTQFRTRNSVEALSQIALYDLSSNLRSKAVATLTDFDHESVFETILLACADPTREVRAAAARGLFRLNFDRAHAWKRIIETNDEFRMSHAARAALEAGIVVKSFDRLVHDDMKVAYEAFCLVSLLVKSGETEAVFDAIRNHKDERVRFALLHVLKVIRDKRTLEELNRMRLESSMPTDVADKIREAVESFEMSVA
jgi:hypothetical protein